MSILKVGSISPNSGAKVNITGSTLLVTTASGHFSGSYSGDGSGLTGVSGFPFTGSAATVSGSLIVTGSTALAFRVSGSSTFTGSVFVSGTVSGSFIGDGSNLTGVDAFPFTGSAATVSGSLIVTGSTALALRVTGSSAFTGSMFVSGTVSGSFIGDGSGLSGISSAPFPFSGSAEITGSLNVTGSAFVTSLTETSALRYKKSVKSLKKQSTNVYKLRPVHFEWKDSSRGDIGLIAEEVQKIYPELVSIGIDGQAEGISYTKLTSVLIKTVQELSARIEKLEKKK
tara:strand:+ start:1046 stop:1900 length:855 start_codon:yes stop_codon:yes gene_type:complete